MVNLYAYLICAAITTLSTASNLNSQMFHIKTSVYVSDYVDKWKTSSAVLCAEECRRRPTCSASAYSSSTGECLLQAETRQLAGGDVRSAHVTAFAIATTGECDKSDAVNTATTTVSWHPSGLKGDLICNNDYKYIGDNATIVCNATGQWIADGECKQRIWRNLQRSTTCEFPRAVSPGWEMCIRGTTCTACKSSRFDLMKTIANEAIFHFRLYFKSYTRAVINSNAGGRWRGQKVGHLSDTSLYGQPFEVEYHLLTDTKIQAYFNGTFVIEYTLPVSINEADAFCFVPSADSNGTVLHFVDIWSGC